MQLLTPAGRLLPLPPCAGRVWGVGGRKGSAAARRVHQKGGEGARGVAAWSSSLSLWRKLRTHRLLSACRAVRDRHSSGRPSGGRLTQTSAAPVSFPPTLYTAPPLLSQASLCNSAAWPGPLSYSGGFTLGAAATAVPLSSSSSPGGAGCVPEQSFSFFTNGCASDLGSGASARQVA